ncbi:MAG: hypothetical protein ACKVKV_02890 [Dehalococcoidia bacterium]
MLLLSPRSRGRPFTIIWWISSASFRRWQFGSKVLTTPMRRSALACCWLLLVASGWDVDETELSLHGYLDSSGAESMKLVLDTYAGCTVVSSGPIKRRKIGGIEYLTTKLEVVTCVV